MGKILMLDKFKINKQKFNNSLKRLFEVHRELLNFKIIFLIIFPNMACKML